jgi:hypothetical protein
MITKNYIKRPSKKHLKFKDLKVGQIFLDDCGNLCMRIYGIADLNGEDLNIVNLETADTDWLDDNAEVRLINKEINITFSDDDLVDWTTEKEDY